jgi:hypothetical protein
MAGRARAFGASLFLVGACGSSQPPEAVEVQPQALRTTPLAEGIRSVRAMGDVDGDEFDDLFALDDDHMPAWRMGSPTGPESSVTWGLGPGDRFLSDVAPAGDVNADGFGDVIVGASGYSNGQTSEGYVRVFLGSSNGLPTTHAWAVESNQAEDSEGTSVGFGTSVASAGDVNGDGYADVIYGAYRYGTTYLIGPRGFLVERRSHNGLAQVHHGSASGPSAAPDWSVQGEFNTELGWTVGSAGDVNGDGYSDVVVASHNDYEARVYYGSPDGLGIAPDVSLSYQGEMINTGAGAGDVNGDGYSDVIIGAYSAPPPGGTGFPGHVGAVIVFHGSSSGLSPLPSSVVHGKVPDAWFGRSVRGMGDVNGDGYADVVVGADSFAYTADELFVFLGSPCGLSSTPVSLDRHEPALVPGVDDPEFGDFNGDGFSDLAAMDTEALDSIVLYGEAEPTPSCTPTGNGGMGGNDETGAGKGGRSGGATDPGDAGEGSSGGEAGALDHGGEGGAPAGTSGGAGGRGSVSGGRGGGAGRQGEAGEPTSNGGTAGRDANTGGRAATGGGTAGSSGRRDAGGTNNAGASGTSTAGAPSDDGGCGCRMAGSERRDRDGFAALLALGLVALARRRATLVSERSETGRRQPCRPRRAARARCSRRDAPRSRA